MDKYNKEKYINLNKFKSIDHRLLIVIIFLSLIGLTFVYSASNIVGKENYNDGFYFFKRQGVFLIISYFFMYFIVKFDITKLEKYVSIIFILCLILLLLVLIPGIGSVRGGARSWISLFGFSIQPSEFMKVGLLLLYSKYLKDNYNDLKSFKSFLMLFSVSIIIFLIIMLQPDFGTGLVIVISSLLLIFITGVPYKYFGFIMLIGLLGITILIISAPYRIDRILAFINPWEDPLGSGFQGIQSLFAITPGGLLGHGFNNSIQKHFFLPEPQNDFIFAIVLEEIGLIGGGFILLLYFYIIYKGVKISMQVDNNFIKFLSVGIVISLATQVFINIGVVVGLLPVTGITLPMFSYGGSSLLITMIQMGLLVSSSKYIVN